MATANDISSGIDPDRLYTLSQLKRITNSDDGFFRALRREAELRVVYSGRQGWIQGSWFIDAVLKHGRDRP